MLGDETSQTRPHDAERIDKDHPEARFAHLSVSIGDRGAPLELRRRFLADIRRSDQVELPSATHGPQAAVDLEFPVDPRNVAFDRFV